MTSAALHEILILSLFIGTFTSEIAALFEWRISSQRMKKRTRLDFSVFEFLLSRFVLYAVSSTETSKSSEQLLIVALTVS